VPNRPGAIGGQVRFRRAGRCRTVRSKAAAAAPKCGAGETPAVPGAPAPAARIRHRAFQGQRSRLLGPDTGPSKGQRRQLLGWDTEPFTGNGGSCSDGTRSGFLVLDMARGAVPQSGRRCCSGSRREMALAKGTGETMQLIRTTPEQSWWIASHFCVPDEGTEVVGYPHRQFREPSRRAGLPDGSRGRA
jgi:hypothetical protein